MDDLKLAKIQIKNSKDKLLEFLTKHNIIEDDSITVALIRKSRDGQVGYYSWMSQFRSRARIVVDPAQIKIGLIEKNDIVENWMIEHEILKTITHEYGHMLAEAIRHTTNCGEVWSTPDWQSNFNNDEELFAEDFSRFACGECLDCNEEFWEDFLKQYAIEHKRLFCTEDEDAPTSQHQRE